MFHHLAEMSSIEGINPGSGHVFSDSNTESTYDRQSQRLGPESWGTTLIDDAYNFSTGGWGWDTSMSNWYDMGLDPDFNPVSDQLSYDLV